METITNEEIETGDNKPKLFQDYLKEKDVKCKYCGNPNNSKEEDLLCGECKEVFGNSLYSEL